MNQGAPAATTVTSGRSGSKIRSAPRSTRLRSRVRARLGSFVVRKGVVSRHCRQRCAATVSVRGRSLGNLGSRTRPESTGSAWIVVCHEARAGTTRSNRSPTGDATEPGALTRTPRLGVLPP